MVIAIDDDESLALDETPVGSSHDERTHRKMVQDDARGLFEVPAEGQSVFDTGEVNENSIYSRRNTLNSLGSGN